jgi:tetratricopeptide (TPR) repeat protein
MRPNNVTARSFLIRAFIQEGRWKEAEQAIGELEPIGSQRDAFYLRGFLMRKQGDFLAAIKLFHMAEKAGKRGVALMRELAWCYSMVGNLTQAESYLENALSLDAENKFVVDLGVQIATRLRNEQLARHRLEQLRQIES